MNRKSVFKPDDKLTNRNYSNRFTLHSRRDRLIVLSKRLDQCHGITVIEG